MVVVIDAELSARSGSAVAPVTEAVFVSEPAVDATTTSVSTWVAPRARALIDGQVTTPPENPAPRLAKTAVAPAGKFALTSTLADARGPVFVVVNV